MVPSPCFLSCCHTLFDPSTAANSCWIKHTPLARQLHFKHYPQLWASSVHLKLFQSQPQVLCKPGCFALQGCRMTASLTCDTDLQFTLLNYLRKKLDNPMINVYIVRICKTTSVTSHSYKATSCTLRSAASVFLFSLWIQCYTCVLTCYDPIPSYVPMVPSFLLLPYASYSSLPNFQTDTLLLLLH